MGFGSTDLAVPPREAESATGHRAESADPPTRQGSQLGVQTGTPRAGDAGLLFPGTRGAGLQDGPCSLRSPPLARPASLPLPAAWLSPARGASGRRPPTLDLGPCAPSWRTCGCAERSGRAGVPVTQGQSRGDTRRLGSRQRPLSQGQARPRHFNRSTRPWVPRCLLRVTTGE